MSAYRVGFHRPAQNLRSAATGRRGWAVLAMAIVLGGQAWAVFVAEIGAQVSRPAGETTLAGEVAGERTVSQTFRVTEAGLAGITVHARSWSGAATGLVTFELVDETSGASYARTSRPVDAVLASGGFTVPLPRLGAFARRRYRLVVAMPVAPPGAGIGLVANRESRYADGALFVNGREQWGDLVFRTVAARPTVASNVDDFLRRRQPLVASVWFPAVLLLVYDLALAVLVRRLFTSEG